MPKDNKTKKPFRLSYRNRTLSFTPFGTRFVVVCVLVGVAAINTGSNLLYLCTAMMLSMVIVSGILSEQALRGIRASRRVPGEIYAGEPFAVRYTVGNAKKRIPSFALSVAGYSVKGEQAGAFILRLGPGETGNATAQETVTRRGEWVTEGFELSTRFPFGLFRKSLLVPEAEKRLAYPPIRELPANIPRTFARGYGEAPSGRAGQGDELRSLRDYQASDDARLIHWKSSARLSRLLVKELEAEHKRTVTVILDDAGPRDAQADFGERFEDAVALAAAAVRHLITECDVPVALVSRGFRLHAGAGREHYLAAMDGLALAKPYDPDAPGADAAEGALRRAMADGPCVLVLTSRKTGWSHYSGGAGIVLEARA